MQRKKEKVRKKEEDRKKEEAKMSASQVKHLLSNGFLDSVSEVMQRKEEARQRKEAAGKNHSASGCAATWDASGRPMLEESVEGMA